MQPHSIKNVRNKVECIIHKELDAAGITATWNMKEIHVLPDSNIVVEYTSSDGTLSQALINHYFPTVQNTLRHAHFTSLDKFKSILSSQTLRLYSLLKRVGEQEFKPFSEAFGLTGYLDGTNGEPYYKTLMSELFYISFTNQNPNNDQNMWDIFAQGGSGVKIYFNISVIKSRSEFRHVIYGEQKEASETLIKKIMLRIKKECNRHFIIRGISRIGAFYLPLGYDFEKEKENRLLIKSWGEGPAHELIVGLGQDAYIPLKLGNNRNPFCELNIDEVQVGVKCNKHEVSCLLKKSGFSNVLVTNA